MGSRSGYAAGAGGLAEKTRGFRSDVNLFTGTLNAFSKNLNGFISDLSQFTKKVNWFTENLNWFCPDLNEFTKYLNWFSKNLNQFTSDLNQFIKNLNQFTKNLNWFTRAPKLNATIAGICGKCLFLTSRYRLPPPCLIGSSIEFPGDSALHEEFRQYLHTDGQWRIFHRLQDK